MTKSSKPGRYQVRREDTNGSEWVFSTFVIPHWRTVDKDRLGTRYPTRAAAAAVARAVNGYVHDTKDDAS